MEALQQHTEFPSIVRMRRGLEIGELFLILCSSVLFHIGFALFYLTPAFMLPHKLVYPHLFGVGQNITGVFAVVLFVLTSYRSFVHFSVALGNKQYRRALKFIPLSACFCLGLFAESLFEYLPPLNPAWQPLFVVGIWIGSPWIFLWYTSGKALPQLLPTSIKKITSMDRLMSELSKVAPKSEHVVSLCLACEASLAIDNHSQFCPSCKQKYSGEIQRVKAQLYRAKKAGTEATLTPIQWIKTLQSFNFLCAYCQEKPYEVMEHMTPIAHRGGTTQDNCVPACSKCNANKHATHFEK